MNWFRSFWKALNTPAAEHPLPFSPRAEQALALARQEAKRLHHNFAGTEHVLLGVLRLGNGVAWNVLHRLSLDPETLRIEVEKHAPAATGEEPTNNIPYTPRVKRVLALATKAARALSHTYVGTEHILLGLVRESEGVAGRVLQQFGVTIEKTHQEILKELDPNFDPARDDKSPPP